MMNKDYYSILQLPPHASVTEIKQAYRKLAMIYHPDKNGSDQYAAAQFNEIKEAYEILTNPVKKELYLQERWYEQAMGRKRQTVIVNPVNILKLALETERYVFTLDSHRMNQQALFDHIDRLLSEETIEKLNGFNEKDVNRKIISTILKSLKPLHWKFLEPLSRKLERLAGNNEMVLQEISAFRQEYRKTQQWDRYKVIIILFFTALLCLLIYFVGR